MTDKEKLQLYQRLADGLSEMVEGGRLKQADIPDDYQWLVEALAKIAGADPGPLRPVTITIEPDEDAENPCDWDGWKVFSFNSRHRRSYAHPEKLGLSTALDDHGLPKITNPGLRRKVEVGLAHFLSYYEHGACMWSLLGGGPQCRWDSTRIAGLLVWGQPPGNMGNKTREAREKDAAAFIETYTSWCNGSVYGYSINDPEGEIENEGCWGFYDMDGMFREIKDLVNDREVVFKGRAADLAEYHWPPKDGKRP